MKYLLSSAHSFTKKARHILMAALFCLMMHTLSASVLLNTYTQADSLSPRLPCYTVFQKEVVKTALSASANARSIESGVSNYIRQFANLNHRFYICMHKTYPNNKK